MAEVVITTKVNNELIEKTVNNFKDLKKEIRAAKDDLLRFSEGSEDFKRVQQNVSKLQTSLKDLGDTAKIQGSGVERLQQSFNLLGEGFLSGDLEKGKIALTGLGQAMSAIPIFLLIEGFQLLYQNLDKVIAFFKTANVEIEGLTKSLNEQKDALEASANAYSRILTLSKAAGASEVELNKLQIAAGEERLTKLKEEEKTIYDIIFAKEKLGEKTDEEQKQLKELDKDYSTTLTNTAALYLQRDAIAEDSLKKQQEAREKQNKINEEANRKSLTELEKQLELEEKIFYNRLGAQQKAEAEAKALKDKEALDAENAYLNTQKDLSNQFAALEKEQKDKDAADEIARNKKLVDDKKRSEQAKVQAVGVGINAAQSLTAAFFAFQLNGAKGNAKEELRIRKQMFEVDKAFNIARAVQDGIRSVQAALTIPPPGGQILAVVNAGLAAANVAKIAATKFDGGASSTPSADTGSGASVPTATSQAPTQTQPGTISNTLVGGNSNINVGDNSVGNRVYVVESDITQTQNRINKIKRISTIG